MKNFNSNICAIVLLSFITACCGCKRESGCTDPAAVNYNPNANVDNNTCQYQGNATFYFTSNGPNATVKVSGPAVNNQSASITSYYTGGSPGCNAAGCANYTLNTGNYTYTATSSLYTWAGSFTVQTNLCTAIPLSTGSVTFWTNSGSFGAITVNVSGYTPASITNYWTAAGPPDCATNGNANFLLPADMSFTYTASDQLGDSWSGTVTATADQCSFVLLQ